MTCKQKYLLACLYLVKQLTNKDINAVVMGDTIVKWQDVKKWLEQELKDAEIKESENKI